jgi:hypothetical protein
MLRSSQEDKNAVTASSAVAAIPKLAASIGFAVAARPDALVEVLPGEPATVLFTSAGRLQAALVLPSTESDTRRMLGLPPRAVRDRLAERQWEEKRWARQQC